MGGIRNPLFNGLNRDEKSPCPGTDARQFNALDHPTDAFVRDAEHLGSFFFRQQKFFTVFILGFPYIEVF